MLNEYMLLVRNQADHSDSWPPERHREFLKACESYIARLQEEGRLVCQRCGLRYRIKDGLANMVVEEAELPAGCTSLDQLPCQREAASGRA